MVQILYLDFVMTKNFGILIGVVLVMTTVRLWLGGLQMQRNNLVLRKLGVIEACFFLEWSTMYLALSCMSFISRGNDKKVLALCVFVWAFVNLFVDMLWIDKEKHNAKNANRLAL